MLVGRWVALCSSPFVCGVWCGPMLTFQSAGSAPHSISSPSKSSLVGARSSSIEPINSQCPSSPPVSVSGVLNTTPSSSLLHNFTSLAGSLMANMVRHCPRQLKSGPVSSSGHTTVHVQLDCRAITTVSHMRVAFVQHHHDGIAGLHNLSSWR